MNQLNSLIKPEAAKIDQAMRDDLELIDNSLLAEVVDYALFNGGKRVRPLLTVLAARLCQQNPDREEGLYRLSMVFEYLHAASLLHDDVIDQSDKRRGRTTANKVWSNTHVILAGDFLHTRAMLLAGTIGNRQCLEIISRATSAMVESEFLQLQNATTLDTSEENYFKVLNGKTAALIAAACETGAIFTNAPKESAAALATFGGNLGLTFQIVDDLLDYLGDPQKTGKTIGNDFQERKMTLPLINALNNANPVDKDRLVALLVSDPESRNKAFAETSRIIDQEEGFACARRKAEELIHEAIEALTVFPDSNEKEILKTLALYVLNRDQ